MSEPVGMSGHVGYRAVVRGQVQGVYFRASCEEEAKRLGVTGWVRNRPDGAVEMHVQGDREAVRDLIAWCEQGPEAARVDRVERAPVDVDPALTDFTTRY